MATGTGTGASEKKGTKSEQEAEQLACPRCDSTNTKFCYYNNYNFSQPRHFCKACRRYWTHGGTLRDIPVGGSTRKNAKRSRTSHVPVFSSAYHLPPAAALVPFATDAKFTTLLNASPVGGIDEMGFGLTRASWPFAGPTWQLETGETGFVGADCFGFPDLAISTPACFFK